MVIVFPIIMYITVLISNKKQKNKMKDLPKETFNYLKLQKMYLSKKTSKRRGRVL